MSLLTLYQLLLAATTQAKTDADAAAVLDAALRIALADADVASVADAIALIAFAYPDAGAALDAALQIALSHSDQATSSEAVGSIGLSQAEAAAEAEAVSSIGLTTDEPVAATDVVVGMSFSDADSVASSDAVYAIGVGWPDVAAAQEGHAIGLGDAELVVVTEIASILVTLSDSEDVTGADAVVFAGQVITDSDDALALDAVGDLVFVIPPLDAAGYAAPPRWLQGVDMEIYFASLAVMLAEGAIDDEEMASLMVLAWTEPLNL